MNLAQDVIKELFGMFLADAKLSGAILVLVGGIAVLIDFDRLDPLIGGGGLLAGCLAILAAVTAFDSRQRGRN